MNRDPFIQIAGVIDREEANLLIDCGVRYLGFPLRLPVHREDISEEDAARIIRDLPQGVHAVLITYLDRASEIIKLGEYLGVSYVQLHGPVEYAELEALRLARPEWFLIKSLIIRGDYNDDLAALIQLHSPMVDAFITDTYDSATGASGATGKVHNWSVSRRLVELSPMPVFLAGGLTEDNVAAAVNTVRPAGVDCHTGVENPDGRKVAEKVLLFVRRAKRALEAL